jgi:metallo-beta-lactamase class B
VPAEAVLPGLWRVGGGSWNGTVPALSADTDANVYLLANDGAAALIDCGTTAGRSMIETNLADTGVEPSLLRDLLLTHSHFDHTQAATDWQRRHGLRTHLNAVGASRLARGDHRLVGHQMLGPGYAFEPFAVDHPVADGETFELCGIAMTAHHLPGHTPDSTLFAFEHAGRLIAVCGDVAFGPAANGERPLGLLSTLWQSDLDQYVESLRGLGGMPIEVLVPGHGPVVAGATPVREALRHALATATALANDRSVRVNLGV